MPKCTRQGCKKDFNEEENDDGACQYHSGAPVFHEGLKSWSCCQDVHRPVLDFESFMLIPGCTPGKHSADKNIPVAKPVQTSGGAGKVSIKSTLDASGKEVYSSGSSGSSALPTTTVVTPAASQSSVPAEVPEDEDDLEVPVQVGAKCLRNGCKHEFVSNEVSRNDGLSSTCTYHPKPPLFHEGSKGYFCCKRRVLEFDEFLRIEGCKTGKHLFVKKKRLNEDGSVQEELVQCRIDHYQTPSQVRVSVFGKGVDKEKSAIQFDVEQVHLDLYLPGSKRFKRTLQLYGPINAVQSTFTIYGTKVELVLEKQDNRSWNLLEKSDADLAGFSLTFGVGGRTGTVGGKELILDEGNKAAINS